MCPKNLDNVTINRYFREIFQLHLMLTIVKLEKEPSECISKEEIRIQIDQIDREIIQLFALRFKYVSEIVKFKKDVESVIAQDRKDLVIQMRGEWAEELGLDKETFQQIFRVLIDHNITREIEILNNNQLY